MPRLQFLNVSDYIDAVGATREMIYGRGEGSGVKDMDDIGHGPWVVIKMLAALHVCMLTGTLFCQLGGGKTLAVDRKSTFVLPAARKPVAKH